MTLETAQTHMHTAFPSTRYSVLDGCDSCLLGALRESIAKE